LLNVITWNYFALITTESWNSFRWNPSENLRTLEFTQRNLARNNVLPRWRLDIW